MRETTANDVERLNVIILVLGSLASIIIMRDYKYLFSFGVASAIVAVNFRLLRKIMEAFFSRSTLDKKELIIKLPVKFLGVTALVAIVVIWGDLSIPFFLLGLSTVFLSLLISQVMIAFSPEPRRKEDGT
jgi:hypothetical protein